LLLTITTTHRPATDLGCLLHKNPARTQTFDLDVGRAHVFYPQASVDACTVALLLDIDPISLVRTARRASLRQYVNDRPYVASSFTFGHPQGLRLGDVRREPATGRSWRRPRSHWWQVWSFSITEHGLEVNSKLARVTGLLGWTALIAEPACRKAP
jgi:hypothetical protein